MNPYAPSTLEPESGRDRCPICRAHVRSARFQLPFGRCGSCDNYLTIRNWDRNGLWTLAIIAIACGPVLFRLIGLPRDEFPLVGAFVVLILAKAIYDRLTGQLVPAVCWGWFAFPDDDRLQAQGRQPTESSTR